MAIHPDRPLPRDERAFESLYRRHERDVYREALEALGNRQDAEDATQGAFLKAYRALGRGHSPELPGPWLRTIVRNVARDVFRARASRAREVTLDRAADARAPTPDGPTLDDLRAALAQLRPAQRDVLVLRELESCSYAEIADALDLSPSAVETLLFRARASLREQLEALEDVFACGDAERVVRAQLAGEATKDERRALRAHVRACESCAALARRTRARRRFVLGPLPLPATVESWLASPASVVGRDLAVKLAGAACTIAIATGAVAGGEHATPAGGEPAVLRGAEPAPGVAAAASRRDAGTTASFRAAVFARAARAATSRPSTGRAAPPGAGPRRPADLLDPETPAAAASGPAPAPAAVAAGPEAAVAAAAQSAASGAAGAASATASSASAAVNRTAPAADAAARGGAGQGAGVPPAPTAPGIVPPVAPPALPEPPAVPAAPAPPAVPAPPAAVP